MNLGRIDLADCTTPEALLATIHKLQGGSFPILAPVGEWAAVLDITAMESLETEGFEGGLMMYGDRSSGTILVNRYSGLRRRRFTIGHELGHFLLPWHTPRNGQGFPCSTQDMAVYRAKPAGLARRLSNFLGPLKWETKQEPGAAGPNASRSRPARLGRR